MKKILIAFLYYLHYLLFIIGGVVGMAFLPVLEYNLGHEVWYWSIATIFPMIFMGAMGMALTMLVLAPSWLLLQNNIDEDYVIY